MRYPRRVEALAQRGRTEALLALMLLASYGWLFVYFEKLNNPNELVRIYMARAIVEQKSYAIGERVRVPDGRLVDIGPVYSDWGYVNDKALVCNQAGQRAPDCAGTLYSVKAPGSSLAAVPLVALQRGLTRAIAGRVPSKREYVLALRWAFGILPSLAIWIFVRRFLLGCGVDAGLALLTAVAGGLGSLSLTYGQMFSGHQLGAAALSLSFLSAFRKSPVPALVGLGAGLAVCLDYPTAPPAALILAGWWLAKRPGPRALGLCALGALPPLLALAHFHSSAFGAPWRTPYAFQENPGFARDFTPGEGGTLFGLSAPRPGQVTGSLFEPYVGLFFWAPWMGLALASPALLLRRHAQRGAGLTAFLIVVYYLVFQLTHALWRGGWVLGPRYVTPMVPFAAVMVGLAIDRLDGAARTLAVGVFGGAAAAAVGATGIASAVSQGFPPEVYNPLAEVAGPLLAHGYVPHNLLQWAGVPGAWSAAPYFVALTCGALLAVTAPLRMAVARKAGAILSLALFAALTALQWSARGPDSHGGAARFLASMWEPNPPPGARPFGP